MTDQTQNPWDTGTADAAANSGGSADAWAAQRPRRKAAQPTGSPARRRPRQNISISWTRSIKR